jgi:phospholipid N-methyltransferase
MTSHLHFLKESVRHLRRTGSIARSSQYLCKKVVEFIDPAHAKVVVELGPGDGVITHHLLERLPGDSRVFIIEVNDAFVAQLQVIFQHDRRVILIHDSAENMSAHLERHGVQQVDYFVSGIPFVMLPIQLAQQITSSCRSWLRTGGCFIQFHYSPLMVAFYRRVFGNIRLKVVPLNIPPALVVCCEKEDGSCSLDEHK